MIQKKNKLNLIKLIFILIIAVSLTYIITPIINNSNKAMYRADFSISKPSILATDPEWKFMLDHLGFESPFEDVVNFMNLKYMENSVSNPCLKVSSFQNKLSLVTEIVVEGQRMGITIISDQKKMLTKCYEYTLISILETELQLKKFLKLKFAHTQNQGAFDEYQKKYHSILKDLLRSNYDLKLSTLLDDKNNDQLLFETLETNYGKEEAFLALELKVKKFNFLFLAEKLETKLKEYNFFKSLNFDQKVLNSKLYVVSPLKLTEVKTYSNEFLYPTLFVIIIFLLGLIVNFDGATSHLKKVLRFK